MLLVCWGEANSPECRALADGYDKKGIAAGGELHYILHELLLGGRD